MTDNDKVPRVLPPIYGVIPDRRSDETAMAARAARHRKDSYAFNRARQRHIAECWDCCLLNNHGCDPRRCRKEKDNA